MSDAGHSPKRAGQEQGAGESPYRHLPAGFASDDDAAAPGLPIGTRAMNWIGTSRVAPFVIPWWQCALRSTRSMDRAQRAIKEHVEDHGLRCEVVPVGDPPTAVRLTIQNPFLLGDTHLLVTVVTLTPAAEDATRAAVSVRYALPSLLFVGVVGHGVAIAFLISTVVALLAHDGSARSLLIADLFAACWLIVVGVRFVYKAARVEATLRRLLA